jgi:GntR family transcriptional regulator, transcriptional repressor for pyruvate dehydrogenase complex
MDMKTTSHPIIEHLREIDVKSPSDIIIEQVKELISTGVLKPGDRLPAERALAERFGVGRGHIREALKRLEFYGILQTIPQSGTVVAKSGMRSLERLIANVLDLEDENFRALTETRALLEIQAARLAATRASDAEVAGLEVAHEDFRREILRGASGLDANVRFHLKIAECAGNPVLHALVRLLAPSVVSRVKTHEMPSDGQSHAAVLEHAAVLAGIRARDPEQAAASMEEHMRKSQEKIQWPAPDRGQA